MRSRRQFVINMAAGVTSMAIGFSEEATEILAALPVGDPESGECLFAFIRRKKGQFDKTFYAQLLGAANDYKEGDEIIGLSAADAQSRLNARTLLSNTTLAELNAHPPHEDELFSFINSKVDVTAQASTADWTVGKLKQHLLDDSEAAIKKTMPGLTSDVIGCVVKLMSNDELVKVGAKIFNSLPGSQIGAKGYLGARVQPNSPTDHPDDIRWQVFDAFAYAVGDVLVGTNPVSSEPDSVAVVQRTLQDILVTFDIDDVLPHCVLSHIDVQAEVERKQPGSTELWFQSIAGTDKANGTFDLTLDKMKRYSSSRRGRFGLYFETGQGADFTNGHGHGFDMVLHESRKYGFARGLTQLVANARGQDAWVHLNDVAGFIGPEVFRSREQLVRCCLEDIVMGKLHGLCLGLDVCSTLHMDVSLDDLDWCLEQIVPACPAYLMALPTKIDPMLGYLTTGFQDHVRLREMFGTKVNDAMWAFYQALGVIDEAGQPTEHFGDPTWVYLQYCRRKGDTRSEKAIREEAATQLAEVRDRGLFVAEGYGDKSYDLKPELKAQITAIYEDGKDSIWQELSPEFIESVPDRLDVATQAQDREDYILHPTSGEQIAEESISQLMELQASVEDVDVQIVVSDGLNAHSIMDKGHLLPFLTRVRAQLQEAGYQPAKKNILVDSGRVRTGYRIGEALFGKSNGRRAIVHVIGERPGTGHHTFSVYITSAMGETWAVPDKVDHDITRVVSGIATTALQPETGADATVRILSELS